MELNENVELFNLSASFEENGNHERKLYTFSNADKLSIKRSILIFFNERLQIENQSILLSQNG